jgi:uncharacterized protein (UPF0548 family)
MLSLRLPTARQVNDFLKKEDQLLYTYAPLGATKQEAAMPKFDNDFQRVVIGSGPEAWALAKEKMRDWQMFPKAWTIILPQRAPLREGQTVAMYARAFGFWWRNSCRIVYTLDEPTRFGFAYGTLPGHLERGEELFLLELDADGQVWYTIRAFSRPRHWLARVGYPLMRRFQARFRRDSAAQMAALV